MVEDVVTHGAALGDSRGLVELPVDAEINPALTIFFFGLRKRGEGARHQRAGVAGTVLGHAIEFIRDNRERDVVGSEKSSHRLEDCTAKTAVPGRIGGKWRGEIRTGEVGGRRSKWHKCGIASGIG